ncbi:amidohydrolase family protein [Corynebacterium lizhenjunii]|nr:amidohydrolase family protein [Corynebacterium lizhenjunii]
MQQAKLSRLGVETGHSPDIITSPEELGHLASARSYEIIRLERLAEDIAQKLAADKAGDSRRLQECFIGKVQGSLVEAKNYAIGVKSIAAYRVGLDLDPARPTLKELELAVTEFVRTGGVRLEDPVIIRFLLWQAIDLGLAIQLHVGYGDDDVDLHRCNPLLMTELFRRTIHTGARFMLLHCYPFHREAGYLADVFPHVYFDVGLAVNYTGAQASQVIAESLELAPFGKILFSTDAYGLPELYLVGAELFRQGLTKALWRFHTESAWPIEEAMRVARMIAVDNAVRAYGIEE